MDGVEYVRERLRVGNQLPQVGYMDGKKEEVLVHNKKRVDRLLPPIGAMVQSARINYLD